MDTKIVAFYLPQFHEIPENNEWWGKGFTEWVNTRKAKPLFKGHYQPKEPLNDNYYCLLDADTQIWQAELAKKYGIYGFCYYHYWFNGKLLLEKPMENMLKNKKVDIPFCISWANETWARTWDGQEKNILIEQKYEGKTDWKAHIKYLIPFFKDERYIKINNRPLMLLYTSARIDNCEAMVEFWDSVLKKEGFAGIHIVETLSSYQTESCLESSKAVVEFEPLYTRKKIRDQENIFDKAMRNIKKAVSVKLARIDAKEYWKHILQDQRKSDKEIYLGAFPRWDNSARKGKRGDIYKNTNPEEFEKNMKQLCVFAKKNSHRFIFINAWNEWAEGAYLEPDKLYGYQYLEALKNATDFMKGYN